MIHMSIYPQLKNLPCACLFYNLSIGLPITNFRACSKWFFFQKWMLRDNESYITSSYEHMDASIAHDSSSQILSYGKNHRNRILWSACNFNCCRFKCAYCLPDPFCLVQLSTLPPPTFLVWSYSTLRDASIAHDCPSRRPFHGKCHRRRIILAVWNDYGTTKLDWIQTHSPEWTICKCFSMGAPTTRTEVQKEHFLMIRAIFATKNFFSLVSSGSFFPMRST